MRNLYLAFLCCLIVVLPGCGMLTPVQRDQGVASLDQALSNGQITQAQHDAAVEALSAKTFDWNPLIALGGTALSIALGVPISVGVIQAKRGPTEAQRQAAKNANKPA